MIGALADGTGFSAAEIDSFDARTLTYWWNMVMAWRQEVARLNTP
ncbi:hypothetical protein [Rhizobium sp. SL86]|nr:hypothetical protein [Rhizobium sp. SL86]MCY1666241.1 hypothetical protein [Rhizobium sp. SL86]MCY1667850.1 hypothetical protein [Rhizobium sp. SL86]